MQPACFSLSSWQTRRAKSSEAVRASWGGGWAGRHGAWGAALLPASSITLQRPGCAAGLGRKCLWMEEGKARSVIPRQETAIGVLGGGGEKFF